MRRVLLLATGDVMAYPSGPGCTGLATGADLLAALPRRPDADVVVEDVPAEPSWDTSPSTMLRLARSARSALLDEGFDGVVVTHGLDTLEETAFLADLLAGPAAHLGGLVFTGALRPLDGPGALADALAAAADPALRGVGAVACLDGVLHAARWVTLADAAGDGPAFSSAPFPELGRVADGRVTTAAAPPPRPPDPRGDPESQVALIKTYPEMEPGLLSAVVDAGARGIVLEGTGMGNVPVGLLSTIAELTEWDIPVVVASRARTGPAGLGDLPYGHGMAAKVGAVGARGLAPVKARGALMAALGGGGREAVRDYFARL
ncbi:asparaginase [Microbispora corallina]|uniref:L-asparaginase n=1 Tax=Microbispora corallina TaxID=83302 RepID=A0ABQ4G073_9ACTN|nr:asparaginase domain-containing protein [Microbispora corallina]GIH40445.1 L-asparaginase [Microbispora corallina]